MINQSSKLFQSGHKRSVEARKNILSSFLIKGINIGVSLIIVPLTINYINPVQYGIWITLSSIIAWIGFFDIGFGNGLRNKLAESIASGDIKSARIYISTTYGIMTLVFGSIWLLFLVFSKVINWALILNAPDSMQKELTNLGLIVLGFFCLQLVLKTINIVLIADQKPAKSAFFDMIGQILSLSIIVLLTKSTQGSITYLALTLGSVPSIVLIFSSIWFYRTKYKKYAPSIKLINFAYAGKILKLGVKFFIIQIAGIIIYQTSNMIIAHTAGPKDVTVYNIAFKYFGVATMIFSIIMTPFWTAFTDAFFLKDYAWMKKAVKNLRTVVMIMFGLVLVMTISADKFFSLWVGNIVTVKSSITLVMSLFVMINIWNSYHSMILNGLGKITLQLYVSSLATIFYIPLALFLGKKYGIEGVVIAGLLLSMPSAIYAPIQVSLLLNQKAKRIWNA